MLNVEQVEQLLRDAIFLAYKSSPSTTRAGYPEDWAWDEVEYLFDGSDRSFTLHGRTIAAESFDTGGEGHGEDVYMVFKTTDVDGAVQYWRKDGYYSSYDGGEWDGDFREVDPVEKVVTFYE
jgi:hypothetical protein